MQFLEICFFENCDLENTSLANKPNKCFCFTTNCPYKTNAFCKSNGKPKLQMRLSQILCLQTY